MGQPHPIHGTRRQLTGWLATFIGGVVLVLLFNWLAPRFPDAPGYARAFTFFASVPIVFVCFGVGLRFHNSFDYGMGTLAAYASLYGAGVASLFLDVWKSVPIGLLLTPLVLFILLVLVSSIQKIVDR